MASDAALWLVWTGLAVIVLLTVGGIRLLQSVLAGETDRETEPAARSATGASEVDASSSQGSADGRTGEPRH